MSVPWDTNAKSRPTLSEVDGAWGLCVWVPSCRYSLVSLFHSLWSSLRLWLLESHLHSDWSSFVFGLSYFWNFNKWQWASLGLGVCGIARLEDTFSPLLGPTHLRPRTPARVSTAYGGCLERTNSKGLTGGADYKMPKPFCTSFLIHLFLF